nr:MogA/MoaB family molybdenum cofactor biosynthesis protein [Desulfarculus baarsii]
MTVSDGAAEGRREDVSGPRLVQMLEEAGVQVIETAVVPDEMDKISAQLRLYADYLKVSLVLTTGGTGLSRRDVTPEATRRVLERTVPGLAEAMRAEGLKITPHAVLSRGVCGIRGATLIINLPGGPNAAVEGLKIILPALPHGLNKLRGDTSDCAR